MIQVSKALCAALFGALSLAAPAAAMTIEIDLVAMPMTTSLTSLDPFFFSTDASGGFYEEYVNDTSETFTDFHFEWTPATDAPPETDGHGLMTDDSATTSSADFEIGTGSGIAPGMGFFINVAGFPPGTEFTAWPTTDAAPRDVPLPPAAALLGLALCGLGAASSRRGA
ncbi:hypothetical protein ACQ5SO_03850 [Rhodovulum sp. DZ06]|uniref:hypothetical protein n=1 Tax=Rhodovulum sp. DZ06 TaxID=3425126 RepID=UPI003D3430DA